MSKHDIIKRILAVEARPLILQKCRIDSCIVCSRLVKEVFNSFSFTTETYHVTATILNNININFLNEQKYTIKQPIPEWAKKAGAWGVGLGFEDGETASGTTENGCGHVITIQGSELYDLSLDQVSRPQHNMTLGPSIFPIKQQQLRKGVLGPYYNNEGTAIIYNMQPENKTYLRSPDWINFFERYDDIMLVLYKRIKHLVEKNNG